MSALRPRRPHELAGVGAFAVVAATDPGSTRLVYAMVAGLAVVGIAFVVLGVWLIRQTRVDLPVLAPLERMGDRDWKRKDAPTQQRLLDEIRPPGAAPLRAGTEAPTPDAEFGQPVPPASFSDLGPGVVEASEPVAPEEPDDEVAEPVDATPDDAAAEGRPDAPQDDHDDPRPAPEISW